MVIKPPDDPKFTIWVDGKPKSLRRGPASAEYVARIQSAAMPQCSAPLGSHLLAVEIWFAAHRRDRADVDNVAGPILDALKGVVYLDDRQVRSVMVTALPIQWTDEDRWKLDGVNEYSLAALLDKDP